MDESLFIKHALQIRKQKNSKEELINYIKDKTGIELEENMITSTKKVVTFTVSSVLKQKLHQKNISKVLEEKGYSTRF
ncbi:glycogen/starch/alpha-glucan phosphorylase [Candidatus Gracilibacteria bacterium]|nr:glycogen/starch/alpha-glucan phosphorylase [Candidatus Gracilibacteria bacterium]MCF7899005.1 glycogen/starch/alpha-glucan phosphorylase [Candidatus Paceibacterota bacterium]